MANGMHVEILKKAYQERLKHKSAVTARMSETCRFVAFGIVAWFFAVHSSHGEFFEELVCDYDEWINAAGLFAIIAVVLDYFQYVGAYTSVNHALNRKDDGYSYNKFHLGYVVQQFCFIVKQVAVGLGALIVVVTLVLFIVK